MSKKTAIAVAFLWLCTTLPSFSIQAKPVLAVLELLGEGVSTSNARIITGYIEESVFNLNLYRIISRTQIDKVIKELEFQQTGACELECAVKVGKQLAARKVIIGSVGQLGRTYSIQIKLIDVETSEMERIKSISAECEIGQLPQYIGNLVNKLFDLPTEDSGIIQPPTNQTKEPEKEVALYCIADLRPINKVLGLGAGYRSKYQGPLCATNKGIRLKLPDFVYFVPWSEVADIKAFRAMGVGIVCMAISSSSQGKQEFNTGGEYSIDKDKIEKLREVWSQFR
ncbi:MAG: hypothetical protein PHI34_04695 [Acidobacteriota bacterium]|nr:hypothetical protein [Acidobacteriota bacterium]